MNFCYAGIGSRETPPNICKKMGRIAKHLNELGFTLRSGHAEAADKAFEAYAGKKKKIYLASDSTKKAEKLTSKYHPNWEACKKKPWARKLHGRNVFIILGEETFDFDNPVDFVVCWTKDGKDSGGTGQGIRIAEAYDIPIFNLYYKNSYVKLLKFLNRKLEKQIHRASR